MSSRVVGFGLGGVLLVAAGAMVVGGGDGGDGVVVGGGEAQGVVRASGGVSGVGSGGSVSTAGGEVLGSRGETRGEQRGFSAGDFDGPLRAPKPTWQSESESESESIAEEDDEVERRFDQDPDDERRRRPEPRVNVGGGATTGGRSLTHGGRRGGVGVGGASPSATSPRNGSVGIGRGIGAGAGVGNGGIGAGSDGGDGLALPDGIPASVAARVRSLLQSGGSVSGGGGGGLTGDGGTTGGGGGESGSGGDSGGGDTGSTDGGGSLVIGDQTGSGVGIPDEVLEQIAGLLGISLDAVRDLVGSGGDSGDDTGGDSGGGDSGGGDPGDGGDGLTIEERAAALGIPVSVLEEIAGILGIDIEGVLALLESTSGGDDTGGDDLGGDDGGDGPVDGDPTDGDGGDDDSGGDDPVDDGGSDSPGDDGGDAPVDDGADDGGDDGVDLSSYVLTWVEVDNGGCVSEAFGFDLSSGERTFDLYFGSVAADTVLAVLSGLSGLQPVTFSGGAVLQHPAGSNEMPGQSLVDGFPCTAFDSWVGIGGIDVTFIQSPDPTDFGGEFVAGWFDFSAQGATGQQLPAVFGDDRFYVRVMRITAESGTSVAGELQFGLGLFGGGSTSLELDVPAFP